MPRQVVYLHGFASSPASSKAALLGGRLAARGAAVHCPDLNAPDFATITASRMIGQAAAIVDALPPGPVALVGSSLGAFVALQVAEAAPPAAAARIDRLICLAPAFAFGRGPMAGLDAAAMTRWRETGWRDLHHHAYGAPRRVHYALVEDAQRYDAFAARRAVPTLVIQGRRDEIVDPAMVRRFAAARPHVTLVEIDDGHQLAADPERLWAEVARFLDLPP